jgi:hypothetical protein
MIVDKISDAIAHFIGMFHLALEEARLRKDYGDFSPRTDTSEANPPLETRDPKIAAPQPLQDFDPGLKYLPPAPDVEELTIRSQIEIMTFGGGPRLKAATNDYGGLMAPETAGGVPPFPGIFEFGPRDLLAPGSLAFRIHQQNQLMDNDDLSIGNHGMRVARLVDSAGELDALVNRASQTQPLPGVTAPGSPEAIKTFIIDAAPALDAFTDLHADSDAVFVARGDATRGITVNGTSADAIPEFEPLRPFKPVKPALSLEDEIDLASAGMTNNRARSADGQKSEGNGSELPDASVDFHTGNNTLTNSAVIINEWLAGSTLAVIGDWAKLNAIVQVNAHIDLDMIGDTVLDRFEINTAITQTLNIAAFEHIDPAASSATAPGGSDIQFPKHWAVARIDGDVVFMNWIQQFNFIDDDDVSILSASGHVTTTASAGQNDLLNGVTLQELGFYYDLIIVGGGVYGANLIFQTNALFDNDLIGAVDGFETTGKAVAKTGGNLLWNEASIVQVGSLSAPEGLPQAFRDAALNFQSGSKDLSDGVLSDAAFAGLAGLRVLYITGNILNLQYISQTNVLGDADQVALAMNKVTAATDAHWTLSTGSNALVNQARIVDVTTQNKTYVGGNHYSDDYLVQTDIIDTGAIASFGMRQADALINEAVAFLDDDFPIDFNGPTPLPKIVLNEGAPSDVMHALLA